MAALTRSLSRIDLAAVQQTVSEALEREGLTALSQRKLNALGLPLAYIDRNQRYRFANSAFLTWIAKRHEDVVGHEVIEVVGREVYALYNAYIDAVLDGERTTFERQLSTPGRPPIWIRVDYYPDRNPQGHIRGFLVTYADVDNVKHVELESGQREHRLRLVIDSVGVPVFYFDRQLKIRFANKPFGGWIGAQADDLLGHAVREVLSGEAFAELQGYIERAFAGATVSWERRDRRANGEPRWVRMSLFPDRDPGGRIGGAFAVMTDIEDDVRIRDALKAQEVQLRLFADNIPGPIAYLDRSLRYTFVNQAFANWVCKPQDEIYGKATNEVLKSDVATFLRPILKRAQFGEHVEYERVGKNANGDRRWMHGRVAPDFDGAGKVRGLYCTEYDIHDLKSTEQALAAREEQLRLFTDNIPEPVVYLDADRKYAFVNESFLQLNGLERDAVIGKPSEEVIGLEASEGLKPFHDRAFAGETLIYERAMVDAQGRMRWIRGRMVPDHSFDGRIQGVYVVGHDITDLKEAQDALAARESQLRVIMDGVPAPVAYIDRDERCHYVNRTFLQFFGLTAEQVAELRLRDVVGHGIYQSAQAMLARALEGEATAFDRLVPGANGVRRWMTIRVVPDAAALGGGARRVRADERHPRPEAGAGGIARLGGRASAHHGQRSRARRVHRPRVPLSLPQSAQRGVAGREPQGPDGTQSIRGHRRGAFRAVAAAALARVERRGRRDRADARAAERRPALGVDPLRAEPRQRRQGDRHLRGPHRRPRPEEQRGRAAPRELDAVLAHQQHAARGARVGSRLPPRPLVAAGGEHLRLDR